ncbi:acetolactate synthase large subunit [Mycolicibacterium baixiangningiae]|uniref:acetolactate synthase large subunit n=1 Tax=Mycolicibacterium baixiangningiae TaxID=2761578 RepID=UPI001865E983|nr:acetolactate synthase large subunit [Mycolicibacterium baixiangningiae]
MHTYAAELLRLIADSGVRTLFANAGTTEIHYLAALEGEPRLRPVLCLFEGVATGAADGWARVMRTPAATLLHLGPGLANGLANLHNARRAGTPMINIVGDHPDAHARFDTPLQSDVLALARWTQGWTRRVGGGSSLGSDAADAFRAAVEGQSIAALIVPADIAWSAVRDAEGETPQIAAASAAPAADRVHHAAGLLAAGPRTAIVVGRPARDEAALRAAHRIHVATGAVVLVDTFPAHIVQGRGIPSFERLGYFPADSARQLEGVDQVILVGARIPATFFAYPGEPSLPLRLDRLHRLAGVEEDGTAALESLAALVASEASDEVEYVPLPEEERAALNPHNWAPVVARLLPQGAIVSDEAVTMAGAFANIAPAAARHDALGLSGLAIGQGLPVALGAALAAPDRPVVALQADGSAMFTLTALWTMARERVNVTIVIRDNAGYASIDRETARIGGLQSRSRALTEFSEPSIDFVAIATGMGVPATRADTTSDLGRQFEAALRSPGPHLIHAKIAGPS